MSDADISFLCSPIDRSKLSYLNRTTLIDNSGNTFPIIRGIPRFVDSNNYSLSFGLQWNTFLKTQIDKFNGTDISKERFYRSSKWDKDKLKGERILEVGSGAGRFTQIVIDAGAKVYSLDYSNAVEANMLNNGPHANLYLYQADIYKLPFQSNYFDKIFCFGVLQHTPNVKNAFMSMIPFLKRGGGIAVDVYSKRWQTYAWSKYWYRPLTKRMNKQQLLSCLKFIIPKWFPVSSALLKIPTRIGFFLSQIIPIANHSRDFPQISKDDLVEWAIMNTFDMLSPEYDKPQTLNTLRGWMEEANLEIIYCGPGDNGYVGVGEKR